MNITKYTVVLAGVVAVFISGPALAQTSLDQPVAVAKKPKKITDRSHPNYVRCRSEAVIGSRAKKKRICMTNSQWKEYAREGSKESRDFVESNQPGFYSP